MLRSDRSVLPVLPAPVITEEVAELAPNKPLQDSPKAVHPALAPALILGGEVHGDKVAVQRPEVSCGAMKSSNSEAADAAEQVMHCARRSGLPSTHHADLGTRSGIGILSDATPDLQAALPAILQQACKWSQDPTQKIPSCEYYMRSTILLTLTCCSRARKMWRLLQQTILLQMPCSRMPHMPLRQHPARSLYSWFCALGAV